MRLAEPLQLAWLGLLVPLVVLYILKRRRQARVVGSTLLWEAALRDLRAERPWKRLVPHLSLLLQALVVIAGALALARPTGAVQVPDGARVIVIVDGSVSMGASLVDGSGRTRMDRARRATLSLFDDLPVGAQLGVVLAGRSAEVLAPLTRQRSVVDSAASRLGVVAPRASLLEALELATERVAEGPPGSRVVLITDRASDPELRSNDAQSLHLGAYPVPVLLHDVGEAAPNTAIIAADARAQPTDTRPDRAEVFARVARYADAPAEVYVTASVLARDALGEQGRVIGSRRVTVTPDEPVSVVFDVDLSPDTAGRAPLIRLAAHAERAPDTDSDPRQDALALDDVAVVPSPALRRLPVFLVGAPPSSVMRVLRTDAHVELFETDLEALAGRPEDAPPLDGLIVYTGRTPDQPPPGDSWVLGPSGDDAFEASLGEVAPQAVVTRWTETDERMRFVRLDTQRFGNVRPIGEAASPLLHTTAGVAAGVITRPGGESMVVATDLDRGDWARDPSFVVFFRNLLERARRRRAEGGVPADGVGAAIRVRAQDAEVASVVVRAPSGETRRTETRAGAAVVLVPAETGAFDVQVGERRLVALRNVLDASASDLRPRRDIANGEAAEDIGGAVIEEQRALWPLLALLMLALITIEALWATRKGATT